MGRHRRDPIPARCKAGRHPWQTVNRVRFPDTPPDRVILIQYCGSCDSWTAKQVRVK